MGINTRQLSLEDLFLIVSFAENRLRNSVERQQKVVTSPPSISGPSYSPITRPMERSSDADVPLSDIESLEKL